MKKGWIIVLLLLLAIPSAFATITFDPLSATELNSGAVLELSGEVQRPEDFQGFIEFVVICSNDQFYLPRIGLTLAANKAKAFPEDFVVPKVTVSNSMSGSCAIEAQLIESNTVLESSRSQSFTVSPNLQGAFKLNANRVQAGDKLSLTGTVNRVDKVPVTGSAEIYFNNQGTKFLVDIVSFRDGSLNYDYQSIGIPSGNYSISLVVHDLYGNSQEFANVASFTLVSDLFVFAKVSQTSLDPGDTVEVSGEAKTILNDAISIGEVYVKLDNETFTTGLKNGEYKISIPVKNTIKSGAHLINVRVEDGFRNYGTANVSIDVVPRHDTLALNVSKDIANPGDVVEITPTVFDQAGDAMAQSVEVTVRDPNGKTLVNENVQSQSSINFAVGMDAQPGRYEVLANEQVLDTTKGFTVATTSVLDINMEGNEIVLKNLGNTRYTNPVTVSYNGETKIERALALAVGKEQRIPLVYDVPTGVYDLIVRSGQFEKVFKGVNITGATMTNLNTFYIVLIIITAVLMLIGMFWGKDWTKKKEAHDLRERQKEKEFIESIRRMKERQPQKKKSFMEGYDKEAALKDYKQQMVKSIKESEKNLRPPESKKGTFQFNNSPRPPQQGMQKQSFGQKPAGQSAPSLSILGAPKEDSYTRRMREEGKITNSTGRPLRPEDKKREDISSNYIDMFKSSANDQIKKDDKKDSPFNMFD